MFRKLAVMTVVAIMGVLGFGITPAHASVFGCPDNMYVCLYENTNFTGGLAVHFGGPTSYCWDLPRSGDPTWPNGSVGNNASSLILNWTGTGNKVQEDIIFYDDWQCKTPSVSFQLTMVPGQLQQIANLFNMGWGNRISSVRVDA